MFNKFLKVIAVTAMLVGCVVLLAEALTVVNPENLKKSKISYNGQGLCLRDAADTVPNLIEFVVQGKQGIGNSVAISGDGNTAIIACDDSALVYFYSNNTWVQQSTLSAGGGALSVAISDDGNTAVIGAPNSCSGGAAYVFTRSGSAWVQQPTVLTPSDGGENDNFGANVAVSGDGNTIIATAPVKGDYGAFYVFACNNNTWTQQYEYQGSVEIDLSYAGSVAVSGDGNTAVVTINDANDNLGNAYVCTRNGGEWEQLQQLFTSSRHLCSSAAISENGNAVIIGVTDYVDPYGNVTFSGAVYAFIRDGNSWGQPAKLMSSDKKFSPVNVSISGNGNIAVAGISGDNAIYEFSYNGSAWTSQGTDTMSGNTDFGSSVAVSGNGSTIIVGASGANSWAGAAYICATGNNK